MGFATFEDLLTNGRLQAAGAVSRRQFSGTGNHTNAMTARYSDIGVATDEPWRGTGLRLLGRYSIVARRIRGAGADSGVERR